MSFWLGTFAFLVLAAASLFATRFVGARAGRAKLRLNYALVTTAWVCMWLMWAIIYMAQMKPLIKPERE
jgi:V-type H+-transporting ATPase subunit e